MIEVRVFATLRQGRDKVTMLPAENFAIAGDIIRMPGLPKVPQATRIDIIDGQIEGLS